MASPYQMPLDYPFASSLFGLQNGLSGYLIPKPKFLYYVCFEINAQYNLQSNELNRIGYLVKSVDRPKPQYKTIELDQYNRKRTAYTKVDYPTISLTMHDTVDGAAVKMIDDYNRFHFGDFSNMISGDNADTHTSQWTNNSITGNDMTYWGYRVKNPNNYINAGPVNRGLPGAEYFFDEIKIYEFYGNKFTMYSLMNPKIESINFGPLDNASSEGQDVTITFNPEGILFRYIDAPIEYSLLASMILPGPGFSTNNFPIADIDLTSFLQGLIGTVGGGLLSNLTEGIYGAVGSLGLTSGEATAIATAANVSVATAQAGFYGAAAASVVSPQNIFFAQGYTDTSLLGTNQIVSANTLESMSYVSGSGSGAITLGQAGSDLGNSVNASVNSLY